MQTAVIIGAGVSGLQTARALLKKGFAVSILEQDSETGGVWSRNYTVPYTCYQFGEFPWTRDMLDARYPSANAVRSYIRAYAEHFGLLDFIRFRCCLQRLAARSAGGWNVTYMDNNTGAVETITTDYVVICTGLYASPNIPSYKNAHQFKGSHMHAKDYQEASMAQGKRVVVIGAGKSAMDCAAEVVVSGSAASVTWLFRQVHWPIPREVELGRFCIPADHLFFSSLPHYMVPAFYTDGCAKKFLCKLLRPGQGLTWRLLQRCLRKQFQLEGEILPRAPLDEDIMYSGSIIDSTWHQLVDHSACKKARPQQPRKFKLLGGWWGRKPAAPAPAAATAGPTRSRPSNSGGSAADSRRASRHTGSRANSARSLRSPSPASRRGGLTTPPRPLAACQQQEEQGQAHLSSSGGRQPSRSIAHGGSRSRRASALLPQPSQDLMVEGGAGSPTPGTGTRSRRASALLLQAEQVQLESSRSIGGAGSRSRRGSTVLQPPLPGGDTADWEPCSPRATGLRQSVLVASEVAEAHNCASEPSSFRAATHTLSRQTSLKEGSMPLSSRVRRGSIRLELASAAVCNLGDRKQVEKALEAAMRITRSNSKSRTARSEVAAASAFRSAAYQPQGDSKAADTRQQLSSKKPAPAEVPLPLTWGERRAAALSAGAKERPAQSGSTPWTSMTGLEGCVSLKPVQGEVAQFTPNGLLLTNGGQLAADLVLYCTGYSKTYDYLDPSIKARLGLQKDGLYLYRSTIPPRVSRLAFVGSEVSTLDNMLTSGLQAEWLAEHWSGALMLPTPEEMEEDIQKQMKWRRQLIPAQRCRGSVYQMYMHQYHAQLVKDMGLKPPAVRLTRLLQPWTADHYQHVFFRRSSIPLQACDVSMLKELAAARGMLVTRSEQSCASFEMQGELAASSRMSSYSAAGTRSPGAGVPAMSRLGSVNVVGSFSKPGAGSLQVRE